MTEDVEMMEMNTQHNRMANCPSCDSYAEFTYAGEQHWPEKVAQAAGMPTVVSLWHCTACNTTLIECELND
jgi:hypothetical protein